MFYIIKLSLKENEATRMLIAEKGESLRSFAKNIGISSGYLTQILNGDRYPSPTVAHKIASGLGLKIEDLFIIKSPSNKVKEVF